MKSSYQRSVRFDPEQGKELEHIAKENDVDISQLVRWAAGALIRHVKRHGGKLILPLDFSESYRLVRTDISNDLMVAETPENPGDRKDEKLPAKRKAS